MPTSPGQIRNPKSSEAPLIFGGLGAAAAVVATGWAALQLAGGQTVPANPVTAAGDLVRGDLVWSTAATVWAVVIVLILTACAGATWRWWYLRVGQFKRVDTAARYLGTVKDIESLTEPAIRAKAAELGVVMPTGENNAHCSPGVPIGTTLRGSTRLFGSFEETCVDVWGTRMGLSLIHI